MNRKPFQNATVKHVVKALSAPGGSRRFLVADEVGLGKTRVAQGVIEALCKSNTHLDVFYICSSLSIIHQNREALLDILNDDEKEHARVDVDRLTLLPKATPSRKSPFTLYTLTPGTLPSGRRTGRADERAVIWELICRAVEGASRQSSLQNVFERSVVSWECHRQSARAGLTGDLVQGFRRELASVLGLSDSPWASTLISRMKDIARDDDAALVGKCRSALARAALEKFSPDLIILDEFQRFFDVVVPGEDEDEDTDARDIVDRLLGRADGDGPANILLSATPYPMYRGWSEGAHGHYEQFLRLIRFLFGKKKYRDVKNLEQELFEYSDLLKSEPAGSKAIFAVRDKISEKLSQVMTRTERPSTVAGKRRLTFEHLDAPIEPLDVRGYRHLVESATTKEDKATAITYWSSIPYPLQMMDRGYQLFIRAKPQALNSEARAGCVYWKQVRRYSAIAHSHPKLRTLLNRVRPQVLALPWLPPTVCWWRLGGRFGEAIASGGATSKALLFSRFRATPRAIASILSYEAERACYSPLAQRARGLRPIAYEYRSGNAERPLAGLRRRPSPSFTFPMTSKQETAMRSLLMFVPIPELADIGDPLPIVANRPDSNLETVIEAVKARLVEQLGRAKGEPRAQPVWSWAAKLQQSHPSITSFTDGITAWLEGNQGLAASDSDPSPGLGIGRAVRQFLESTAPDRPPSSKELRELAEIAVLGPGNVLFRAVQRVFGKTDNQSNRICLVTRASVASLRTYLDHPDFHLLFRAPKQREHPAAIRQAVWDGNLESVLDEYLSMRRGLGVEEPSADIEEKALQALSKSLSVGTVNVNVHETGKESGNETFKMRCHAALPFGLSADEVETETGNFRSDDLRHSFNSPFRPHLLATTSIGQEGLDFHVWCDRVIHWDLPNNPVDLEQRDGRIDRYASLSVRRALAAKASPLKPKGSPWQIIADASKSSKDGMSPWWVCEGASISRMVIVPSLSKMEDELERLRQALSLYRMALGQADQESLINALHRRMSAAGSNERSLMDWLDKARISLAPSLT